MTQASVTQGGRPAALEDLDAPDFDDQAEEVYTDCGPTYAFERHAALLSSQLARRGQSRRVILPGELEMATSPLRDEDKRNPRTIEEARSLVRHVESLFMPWNIESLVAGFTDDCVVRFGVVPEFHGRDALREFFIARRNKQKGYRLKKQFRTLVNDIITNVWDGEWEDATTGRPMKGFGVEVWTMRDGKIALWEAAFNAGPADQAAGLAHVLG